jgi:hypothetical protein
MRRTLHVVFAAAAAVGVLSGYSPQATLPVWKRQIERAFGSRNNPQGRLTRVGGVVIDRQRNLIVSQPDSHQFVVFRQDGSVAGRPGKKGGGPGEFTLLSEIGQIGDTLFAVDDRSGRRRAHFYDSRFRSVRTVSLPLIRIPSSNRMATSIVPLAGGRVFARGAPDLRTQATTYYVAELSGANPREIARATATRGLLTVPGDTTLTASSPVLAMYDDYTLARVAPGGGFILVVDRTAAKVSTRGSYRLTSVRPDGSQAWTREYSYKPAPLSSLPAQAAILDLAAQNEQFFGGRQAAETALRKALGPLPKFLTPVLDAVVGSDGSIWLARQALNGSIQWEVLDSSGAPMATVTFPSSTIPLAAASRGGLWSVAADDRSWVVEQYRLLER